MGEILAVEYCIIILSSFVASKLSQMGEHQKKIQFYGAEISARKCRCLHIESSFFSEFLFKEENH